MNVCITGRHMILLQTSTTILFHSNSPARPFCFSSLLSIKGQTMKTSYLIVQSFLTVNSLPYVKATISFIPKVFIAQPPALSIGQIKLPSSTNIPCLFTGRPVIKITSQYVNTKTPLTKAVIQSNRLSPLLFVSLMS